ncbi:TlpA family protein disulfide reductase [Autumnicola musiva]|uniref:Redoxin domain-containing protein n=1 Tax=Autumnicola musiva TaxID=3075589 RepID=A0ABU3D435_9FLAO|nr:redoxin domain-containing protein [Zunongwangia sp. F117]MDT0676292.1 redoxin domain-containing protein [Zunongwangia sp. F117]
MRKYLLLFLLISGFCAQSQDEDSKKIYFSQALYEHLPKYESKARTAYRFNDYERGRFLFDSLVKNCLRSTYIDNFKFYKLNKRPVRLYEFDKPLYLITYASWCVPEKGEIPAINKLADKYQDKVKFVVLFWDKASTAKKIAKEFNSNVFVVYIDERKNNDPFIIKTLKHSLGLPTCFLISKDKKIMDIRRSIFLPYNASEKKSYDLNYNSIEEGISSYLMDTSPVAKMANILHLPQ